MDGKKIREIVEKELGSRNGFLRLRPAWVARDFLKPGRRLGLREDQYAVGKRGFICERWLASETEADNAVKFPDEGLSFLDIDGQDILLRDAMAACGDLISGKEYAAKHTGLGRLAKIYDFESRIFFHYHQTTADARKLGFNSKEEQYFFPTDVDMGRHPETFFGVHPSIVEQNRQEEVLLPYLEKWEGDGILSTSRAFLNVPGEGFHLPAGILHAPGTAVTIELQEPSDVMGVLQAEVDGLKIDKALLFKHIPKEEVAKKKERAVLDQLLWPLNGDPYFYENHHTPPILIPSPGQTGGFEQWVYYNTTRFSGKRLVVKPGQKYRSVDKGVHNLLIWRGKGTANGLAIESNKAGLDELLISHSVALSGVEYVNTGSRDLEIIKFFGPDVNVDNIPYIKKYPR
jgi:hypothetical protein